MQMSVKNHMIHLITALFCVAALPWMLPCIAYAANGSVAGGKTGSMSIIYGILFGLSFFLFLAYCFHVKKKTVWFVLLYISVFVVNGGYLALSLARDLNGALLANQISYFGAAMLPLSMLMIVADICHLRYPKWAPFLLAVVSFAAFVLAASGSYFGLYYKEVSIVQVNGMTCLKKIYGPLHFLYTVYLFSYFGMMVATIVYASVRKIITSSKYAMFIASAVFGNLIIWLVEQLVHVDFEFLSVSYIFTELMLLVVHSMMQDYDKLMTVSSMPELSEESGAALPPDIEELFTAFAERAAALTATERSIMNYYADGREISEVAELAFISIHTVRKHNANIYQKLGIGSRDELMLYIELFRRIGRLEEILEPPVKSAETISNP